METTLGSNWPSVTWKRFGEPDEGDLLEEFSKMRQKRTVEEYIDKFEKLRTEVMCHIICHKPQNNIISQCL